MKTVRTLWLFLVMTMLVLTSHGTGKADPVLGPTRADALVLVNSSSDAYADFQRFVKPYLDHFGIPYTLRDIVTYDVGTDASDYAVIIIGHRRLDPDHLRLDLAEEGNIAAAVNLGTGLVNFDNDLSGDGSTPRYSFVNTIFGFGYGAATTGSGVSFPGPLTHYITERHAIGSSIGTGVMTLAGIASTGSSTAVATSGGQPFLAVATYGSGRAVQWGSTSWMSASVLGPMGGLDDLVWRGIVWAAHKPFVMQGLPPFLTMRVDDESGPFEWMHIANEFGIKPWAGLFFHNIDSGEAADLSALTHAGLATVSIHAFNGSFFYFDHGAGVNFLDSTVAANFAEGTTWHTANSIPISKYVLPHYYEFGSNVFQGLKDWGVEFVGTQMNPGQLYYGSPWVMNGPFRLYENGDSSVAQPHYYADYMNIPGHPELDGDFFNCVTEIRDDLGYEWYPNLNDVPYTIYHGTLQTKRALDSMALATLFTHAYYVSGAWGSSAATNWRSILAGITANLAPYDPINVTMEDACRYVRAVHNSDISSALYDSGFRRITATFTGGNDIPTKFYVFTGEGGTISQTLVDVPQVTGPTQVVFTLPGPLARIDVTPNPATVVAGVSQQFSVAGFDAAGNPIPGLHFTWSVVAGGGSIDATGRFTAGLVGGTYTDTVAATSGGVQGFATVQVTEPVLDHFDFAALGSPKYRNVPFTVTVTARDAAGNRVVGFAGSATLSDTTGTVTPFSIGPFSGGVWSGPVTIAAVGTGVTLTATQGTVTGVSGSFDVTVLGTGPFSLWPTTVPGTPYVADGQGVELGVKFRAAVDGYITALRFYRAASNTGPHVGRLWDTAGNRLAQVDFTAGAPAGWQEAFLASPVLIRADQTYIASYHTSTGYAADRNAFASGINYPPLRALRNGEEGGNGVYEYDPGVNNSTCTALPCVPSKTYEASNYYVDVVFATTLTPPPLPCAEAPCSIWPSTTVPGSISNDDPQTRLEGVELGVRFRSSIAGYITGVQFYKGPDSNGVHVGHLWNGSGGNYLAEATFTGETGSGWQQAIFDDPIPVQAGTIYVASYHTWDKWAIDRPYFTVAYERAPLRALADGEAGGGNGVYAYGPASFPNGSFNASNYWVDVLFTTTPPAADTTPPTVSSTSPLNGAVGVSLAASVTVTFSEAMAPGTISASTFTLRPEAGGSDIPATVSYSNRTATLVPSASLSSGTTYRATVSGNVTDVIGNLLGADYSWTFTTGFWGMAPWWDGAWGYRLPLTVANTSPSAPLPTRYSVKITLDTAALVSAGRLLPTCTDLRLLSFDGLISTEIDRLVERCNTSQTDVWFALQRPIAPAGQDIGYYLYYGNVAAGAPLADGMNVFLFFEDWERGTTHWTGAGGLDPQGNSGTMGFSVISGDQAVSPSNSQQFPQKRAGGDAFSGYIPVTPGTGYAIRAWATSATGAYVPVGVDPYTSGFVKGTEIWLWTNEWTVGSPWTSRSASFTVPSGTAYIKIKSEWWSEGPGTASVYLDDLSLRYALASEPAVSAGLEETGLPAPEITNIHDTGAVEIHTPIEVSADVSCTDGTADSVTLKILSPETADVPMTLVSGDGTAGTWRGSFTPAQGGVYAYRILAHSTAGRSRLSPSQSFTSSDTLPPVITPVSVIDPILMKNTQTLVVQVGDNGQVALVTVRVGAASYPMARLGDRYSTSWQVMTAGTIAYTVTATDTASNTATLDGSFQSQARPVDVCTWKGCKAGAASWSDDDSNNNCRSDLENAGFRGTFYVNGNSPQQWYADYSAAGHEIGAHTVGHPCDGPCCGGSCTPAGLWQCPYLPDDVIAYRRDQFEPNIAAIEAAVNPVGTTVWKPVLSGAWPCGCTDARRMTAAQFYLVGIRGYNDCGCAWVQDVNATTPTEFMNLNGLHAYDQTFIDRAIAEGKWTIVTSHGACDGIAYMGSRSASLWLAPVGEVLKYIKVRDAAQISNYSRSGRTITVDAAHNLAAFQRPKVDGTFFPPVVFDNPVTLKINIMDSDQVLGVTVNGNPAGFSVATLDGARFVLVDAALQETSRVVVTLSAPAPVIGAIVDNTPVELGAPAVVSAVVTIPEGSIQSVMLRVLAPEAGDYSMGLDPSSTDRYRASFSAGRVGQYSYRVLATNAEGSTSQSALRNLLVQDTTPPQWRDQAQSVGRVPVGGTASLSAEGRDPGGLSWAILATDESGSWQEFNYPVSDWWNHAWAHRRAVILSETAGLARTAETVDLAVSSADFPGLAGCAGELRVADSNRVEVASQVYDEQTGEGGVTCRLLFQATVGPNDGRTYYVYYGNPTATPPAYTTDLSSTSAGGGVTVLNSFFDLFLDADSGIISRVLLPQGSATVLPLSPESDYYWGWHQVCSGAGNLSGKNRACVGGAASASGLVPQTVLDGPIAKRLAYAIARGPATYNIAFQFFANSPYYHYTLGCSGTGCSAVLSNTWLMNGYFTRLGDGVGGAPSTTYNTYDSGADHVRIASFNSVAHARIDGTDNDGADLGGPTYDVPAAPGLDIFVTTAPSQGDTEGVLARIATPLAQALGPAEDAPAGQYGSPADLNGATNWTPSAFTWTNPAVPNGTDVHWRVRYCDLQNNCTTTPALTLAVSNTPFPTVLSIPDDATGGFHASVWVPISVTIPSPPDRPDIYGVDLAIQFDPGVLQPVTVLPSAAAAAAGFAIEYNDLTPGTLLISEYSGQDPLPYAGGEMARIQFYVKGGVGTSTGLSFTHATFNEVPVDPANLHNGRLTVTCSGSPDGTPCDADGSVCTVNDSCQAGVCRAGSALNCDDGNPCSADSCDPLEGCRHPAGNGGAVCRAADGSCDVAELCTGSSTLCPDDAVQPATHECRAAAGVCDVAESCDGAGKACPPDVFEASSTVCRSAEGTCDAPEICTGSGPACPGDAVMPGGTVCRPSTDPCDGAEMCDGVGKICPADLFICGVSGTVRYYRDNTLDAGKGGEPSAKPVPDIGILRTQGPVPDTRMTDAAGAYAFTNLLGNMTVTTLARYEDPPWAPGRKAAITSTDAARIAFAAVGIETLSANQVIAGDVTGNGSISALDASNVARFAAELVDHFPAAAAGSDWRFLRCDTYAEGCGEPVYDFSPLARTEAGVNFYAILYGDVTGNWTWQAPLSRSAEITGISSEEQAAMFTDSRLAEQLKQEAPVQAVRKANSRPAELSLKGWTPLKAGQRRQVVLNLRNAEGILGLDLNLGYDPASIAIVGVQAAGIGSRFNVAGAGQAGVYRVAAYGVLPLSGSGTVVTVTLEALKDTGRGMPVTISGVANEGAIPVSVRGGARGPGRE